MSIGSDTGSTWVGKKPLRRIGGMSDALSIAADLGFYVTPSFSVADFQWTQNFKEPPSVWGEMLRPIPVAVASCTRFFEAMSAMRESFVTLQHLRVGSSASSLPITPANNSSQRVAGGSDCITPPPLRNESSFDDLAIRSLRKQELERKKQRMQRVK